MTSEEIVKKLKSLKNPKSLEGMKRFGIETKNAIGISIPTLRTIAKGIGKNHNLALELWDSGYHEARILAGFIDDPKQVTEKQIEKWAKGFDSWDDCDLVCGNLFDRTKFAYPKVYEWSKRKEEFVKRSGFTLIACLATHDKKAKDSEFLKFFPLIKRESKDDRNFVRKAVNWALRGIGKRNKNLNKEAIKLAKEIKSNATTKCEKWIASNALTELQSKAVQNRLKSYYPSM